MVAKMHDIWNIPDLTELIMAELSRGEQVRLLQVSWLILEAAAPSVWSSIQLPRLKELFDVESGELRHKVSHDSIL